MSRCPHAEAPTALTQVCQHLVENEEKNSRYRRFSGTGRNFFLVCWDCRITDDPAPHLRSVCEDCLDAIEDRSFLEGSVGLPAVLERPAGLHFRHQHHQLRRRLPARIVDVAPASTTDTPVWVALVENGEILVLDVEAGEFDVVARLREQLDLPYSLESWQSGRLSAEERGRLHELEDSLRHYKVPKQIPDEMQARFSECSELSLLETGEARPVLAASPDGRFAAIYNRVGRRTGVIFDLTSGDITMRLDHEGRHSHASPFPISFFQHEGRPLLVHATAANRLDVSDPATGELLTSRPAASRRPAGDDPTPYLDYFHGALLPSPDGEWIADDGWMWHPVGLAAAWNLRGWVTTNVWESETGPSRRNFCPRNYLWDVPLCWVGTERLVIWGFGEDVEWIIPGVRIFDVISGEEQGWFPGPVGQLAFDGKYLHSFSKDHGTSVWDVDGGARVHFDWGFRPVGYHFGSRSFLTILSDEGLRVSRLG